MAGLNRFGAMALTGLMLCLALPAWSEPVNHIVMVGDTLLGNAARSRLQAQGYDYTLRRLGPVIAGKDWLVGNLEGPISDYTLPLDPRKAYAYQAALQTAPALRNFGFDMMCLANNHVLDYGPPGMRDTLNALDRAGIRHFGAGDAQNEATRGRIVALKGIRFGFLGFLQPFIQYQRDFPWFATAARPGVARMDKATVTAAIRALRPKVDVLIVSFHWGRNYLPLQPIQKQFARIAIDAGADLVVGHHPHVPQGVEIYHGVPILYSLGNFAFGSSGRWRLAAPILKHGWVADIAFAGKHLTGIRLQAIAVDNHATDFQARPAPEALPELVSAVQRGLDPQALSVAGHQAVANLPRPAAP